MRHNIDLVKTCVMCPMPAFLWVQSLEELVPVCYAHVGHIATHFIQHSTFVLITRNKAMKDLE